MDSQKPQHRIDVLEHGRDRDGNEHATDRRLFMQLHVFSGCRDTQPLIRQLEAGGLRPAVLYLDVNHPRGVGLLTMSEDPADFVTLVRPFLNSGSFASLTLRPEFTMLGRSYASGYEPDVEDWLIGRPQRTALNPKWPWAVWYPLRRTGAFQCAAAERAAKHSEGAWRCRPALWTTGSGPRHPAGLSRNRHQRQRVRHRPGGQGPPSALPLGPEDAPDAADLRVHAADGTVLRGTGAVAELHGVKGSPVGMGGCIDVGSPFARIRFRRLGNRRSCSAAGKPPLLFGGRKAAAPVWRQESRRSHWHLLC